ncbi:uncharacterized protein [Macrobrachium rosenbergii]|uniref:uncharacterized protein n=1 Tax=Macrobrachium rosenbergii TaxID=79674 RepID=UPI0034D3DA29
MSLQKVLFSVAVVLLATSWFDLTIGQVNAKGGVVISHSSDDQEHFQFGEPGKAVFGAYSWRGPDGKQYIFRYVADSSGFRIRGPEVPVNSQGVAANGEQVNPETPADGYKLS